MYWDQSSSDTGHLPNMVDEVRQLRDELSINETDKKTVVTADRGYFSIENIKKEGEGKEGSDEPRMECTLWRDSNTLRKVIPRSVLTGGSWRKRFMDPK